MTTNSIEAELKKLRAAVAGLEAQRAALGDEIVTPAIESLCDKIAVLEAQVAAVRAPAEERRVITILFTDVVGSTSLAEKLDPEEWREIVAKLHATVGDIIGRHHGQVAQYLGDGLLALFGAQDSNESDPENAIRAALDAQVEVGGGELEDGDRKLDVGGASSTLHARYAGSPTSNLQPPASNLQIRIGIHSGLVVVGDLGSEVKREFTATGDAMNLAARLQSAAPPGGVLISHDTYRHVRGIFDVAEQPPLTLKGKSQPIQTYLVRRVRPRPFRTVTRGVAGIDSHTVGREAELTLLQAAFETALAEHKTMWAQIVGQPGMGKSRLLSDMTEYLAMHPDDIGVLRARAFQGDEKQAFGLIRRMWFDRFQIAEDTPLAEAEAKWEGKFLKLRGPGFEEAAHALGLLTGLPFMDSPHIGAMRHDPAQVKGRAMVVSRELLASLRERAHIVLLLEDLHWADASSWEYLTQVMLAAEAGAHGVFVLATARPEWNPPAALLKHAGYVQIHLAALPDSASRELVLELLSAVEGVPDDLVRLIVERAEGVPYFVEEMVNWFLDRGIIDRSRDPWRFDAARLKESPLPATLQHLLLTRLSSLRNAERIALQRGSIFGRNFWEGGLAVLGAPADTHTLGPLQPRGFVEAQPESSLAGETEWSFHHNLLYEVTYESVLKRERKGLHKAAAAWLETHARQAGRLDEFVAILGEHAERAGEFSTAAGWFVQAGERAKARGAMLEARRFFERALELASPEDREWRWLALLGRSDVLSTLGETEAHRASVPALLELAKDLDDSRLAEAHYRQAVHLDKTGDLRAALQAYDSALAVARRAGDLRIETLVLGMKVICQNRLGDSSGAAATAQEALGHAREVDEASAARAMNNVAAFYMESGDLAKAAQLLKEQAAIHHRLGDRAAEANALVNLGYDYVLLGMYERGITALEQSMVIHQQIGNRRESAYALLNLGLAHWRSGQTDAARRVLEEMQIELAALDDTFGRATGLTYLALAVEQAGEIESARWRFERARELFERTGVRGCATDALAGLARCSLAQGNLDEARHCAGEAWDYLVQQKAQGLEFPTRAFVTCAQVFDALGETEKSHAAIEEGYWNLISRAEKISNLEWGKFFLANVPEHRALLDLWERVASPATANSHTQPQKKVEDDKHG